jgi:nucleoside-diphosphate-sugar epimerase
MRILMIGGTAFVGRHMAAAALDAGHDVTLVGLTFPTAQTISAQLASLQAA